MHEGPLTGIVHFMQDLFFYPASRSITFDICLFYLSAAIWMIIESKRLGIKHVWLYLAFGVIIAISVTFPLFLIAREKRLKAPN